MQGEIIPISVEKHLNTFLELVEFETWMTNHIGRKHYSWERMYFDLIINVCYFKVRSKKKRLWVLLRWG